MRRYFFYLFAALFAFALGVSLVFEKRYETISDSVITNLKTEYTDVAKQDDAETPSDVNLTCRNRNLLPVWNYLKSELEKDYYFLEIGTNCANFFKQVKAVDLNGDGKKEKIIQGLSLAQCAPVGNCSFFVFEKASDNYQPLLSAAVGSVQRFEISKNKTNGYHDLILKTHISASDSGAELYKFDGQKYVKRDCWEKSYIIYGPNGREIHLKKPRIYYGGCTDREF